jgi:hypothetical protein
MTAKAITSGADKGDAVDLDSRYSCLYPPNNSAPFRNFHGLEAGSLLPPSDRSRLSVEDPTDGISPPGIVSTRQPRQSSVAGARALLAPGGASTKHLQQGAGAVLASADFSFFDHRGNLSVIHAAFK